MNFNSERPISGLGPSGIDEATALDNAVRFAERVLQQAAVSGSERRKAKRLDTILSNATSRNALMRLTDEVLRTKHPTQAMHTLSSISASAAKFPFLDRFALRAGSIAGKVIPTVVKRFVDQRIIGETNGVIIEREDAKFAKSIATFRSEGFSTNINVLGESILGNDEADDRLTDVLAVLQRGDTGYVSVKISALCANLDVLAFDDSVNRICERLRVLYRAAMTRSPVGFVNLDMEEYRDLALTVAAFTQTLNEPEFHSLSAGIVLQAYLPDSANVLNQLAQWSLDRHATFGTAPIKVRLVKGANLAMETVEAEMHGWISAPYATKHEVDANLKRLLEIALDPALDNALKVGLGSHNLFDIGWAWEVAGQLGQRHRLEIEMLAGMAPAQARVVSATTGGVRIYAPTCERSAMEASIAYLARRLDENAAPENFLRNLLRIAPGTPTFEAEEARFRAAVADRHSISTDRLRRPINFNHTTFANVADSDFTLTSFREDAARRLATIPSVHIPLVDSTEQIDAVIRTSVTGHSWGSNQQRRDVLMRLAELMEHERTLTLALMAHSTAKTVHEGDPEVSEAIDAVRYAVLNGGATIDDLSADLGAALDIAPVGTVVVVAPWNFPYAIPTLAIASALVAGNSVVLKPAPEATRVGAHLVDQCRRAGVPHNAIQLVVCEDGPVGTHLVTHDDVELVVLTGSSQTAQMFFDEDPGMRLTAETSGKNTMIITDAADSDAAIGHLIKSAFGHAGQKCSAASLAILVGKTATDDAFLTRLSDAVRSLRVGSPMDLSSVVGPLIGAPSPQLLRALTTLDPGESWLVEPKRLDDTGTLWSPGVRLGVASSSWLHRTECFGPVLGIMTAGTLDEAIAIQNSSTFGLTGGLCSLDPTEVEHWLANVRVGNAYVNRPITGAIVGRQPFGGWKASSVGGGSKPGGPDHILGFVRLTSNEFPAPTQISNSYAHWHTSLYGVDTDAMGLRSERNVLRHHALRGVVVLAPPAGRESAINALSEAAALVGTPLHLVHSRDAAIAACIAHSPERIRLLPTAENLDSLLLFAHEHNIAVDRTPVVGHGRTELGRWVKEQSISVSAHRHGRLIDTMDDAITASRRAATNKG
jgi:RHH-type transcriptional regulator, proline utilization regulon repressor / proline dehydrogenase / delta 1-pyrroline-5-carboxylate dehydrogenase